jgi:phage terminase large subunit-like protein
MGPRRLDPARPLPEAWARRVANAAHQWGDLYTGVPAKIVAEKNQGGDERPADVRT